jgi:hypothetical protein
VLKSFRGDSPVFLHFAKEKKVIKAGEDYNVDLSGAAVGRLEELLGRASVKVKRVIEDDTRDNPPEATPGNVLQEPAAPLKMPAQRPVAQAKPTAFFSILDL